MPTIYTLRNDFLALDALIDECGGDVSHPDVLAAWDAMAKELADDTADKLEGYYHYIRNCEMKAAAAKAEQEQYGRMAKTLTASAESAKARVKLFLEATRRKSVTTTTGHTFAIRGNGGSIPVILADTIDPAALPDLFVIVRREPDKHAIRTALEAGEPLPFARLGERGTSLTIK